MSKKIEIDRETCNLNNSAFFLYEAADMCVREMERRLNKVGGELRHESKKQFNAIKETVHRLQFLVEDFAGTYEKSFGNSADKYTEVQRIASFYARLALTIGDRCNKEEDWTKENLIMEFVSNMPPKGNISEETLNHLIIK